MKHSPPTPTEIKEWQDYLEGVPGSGLSNRSCLILLDAHNALVAQRDALLGELKSMLYVAAGKEWGEICFCTEKESPCSYCAARSALRLAEGK